MRKVVVTGGSGRLGQFVIRDLLARGYQVLSLDKVPPREKLCPSWLADLRHAGDLFEALQNAYGIVHLGAYQAPNLAPDAETLSNNVSSTYNVLRAAADAKVKKVVLASSTAAFGFIYAVKLWAPDYLPLDEKHPSNPQDSYGLSKVLGEKIARSQRYDDQQLAFPRRQFRSFLREFQRALAQSVVAGERLLDVYRRARRGDDLPVGAGGEVHRP